MTVVQNVLIPHTKTNSHLFVEKQWFGALSNDDVDTTAPIPIFKTNAMFMNRRAAACDATKSIFDSRKLRVYRLKDGNKSEK